MQPAFETTNRAELVQQIIRGEVVAPSRIRPDIPHDLEAIVLKAMARQPQRRYQAASHLAKDLQRFLEDRPVRARRIGSIATAWRWMKRNPAVASLSTSLLLVVLCSFLLISSKWRDAVVQNQRAEDNLVLALDSMDKILERFASSWMAHPIAPDDEEGEGEGSGTDMKLQVAVSDYSAAVLQDALKFYDRFAQQNAPNPKLQRDTARVHRRVGDIYARLGQYAKAEEAYKRSLDILSSSSLRHDAMLTHQQAITLNQMGLVMHATSRFDAAEQTFRVVKGLLSNEASQRSPECLYELARTNSNLGTSVWYRGGHVEAQRSHRRAIQLLQRLAEQHPGNADYRLALARAYRVYFPFVAFGRRGEDPEAVRSAAIEILERLVNDFPDVPDYQCELSEMLSTTARRSAAADTHHQDQLDRSVELARQLTAAHPSIPRYRAVLARSLWSQARLVQRTDQSEAERLYVDAGTTCRQLMSQFPEVPAYQVFLAMMLHSQARNQREQGLLAESRQTIEEAIQAQSTYLKLRPDNRFGRMMLARQYDELSTILRKLDAHDEADAASRTAKSLNANR